MSCAKESSGRSSPHLYCRTGAGRELRLYDRLRRMAFDGFIPGISGSPEIFRGGVMIMYFPTVCGFFIDYCQEKRRIFPVKMYTSIVVTLRGVFCPVHI